MKSAKMLAIPRLRSGWRDCQAILVLALGLMVCQAKVSEAAPMGTAFTYQGRLMDANDAADEEYDFQFKLFDANVAGTQQGSTIDVNNADVIDGYFTVELDFGSDVFDGDARWLEIGVRPGVSIDPNAFVTLSPRQEVTPVPYALYAGSDGDWMVSGGDMYAIPSGNVGIGTTSPAAKLTVAGGILRSGSTMYGANAETHINLGIDSTTGTFGQDYSYATVGGGYRNDASGHASTIGGGYYNGASDYYATVGGGYGNYATVGYATVGGGMYNDASAENATVGGGGGNDASGYASTVGGGEGNDASGYYATVGGGRINTANGNYSFAAGRQAKANHKGTFVWADSTQADFASTGDDQFLIRASGGVGIGTTNPGAKLEVNGQIKITGGSPGADKVLTSDASGLASWQTPAGGGDNLGNHIVTQNIRLNGHWLSGDGGNEGVFVDNAGNVGIGTASPLQKLHVKANSGAGEIRIEGSSMGIASTASVSFYNSTPTRIGYIGDASSGTDDIMVVAEANNDIRFYTNPGSVQERLRITSSGNVGIGTTSPDSKLEVTGSVAYPGAIIKATNSGSGGTIAVYGIDHSGRGVVGSSSTGYGVWGSSSLSGKGVFGKSSTGRGVHGYATASSGTNYGVYGETASSSGYAGYFEGGKNYFEGNVGIGTTSPQGKLDVNGSIYQRGSVLHADYVFEPGYKLESIDEHSEFMWQNKHLSAIPKAKVDEAGKQIVEVGAHRKGIVEELEKAHIYIEQLHKRVKTLEEKLMKLEAGLNAVQ